MISDGDHVEFLVAVVPCAFPDLKLELILGTQWLLVFTARTWFPLVVTPSVTSTPGHRLVRPQRSFMVHKH
jgi:hypothetical protein